jgi:hypothetical protein
MILALVAACDSPAPDPSGLGILTTRETAVVLDGVKVGDLGHLASDPTSELDPTLVSALEQASGRSIAVVLPRDTPLWVVRRIVGSAREAGAEPVEIGASDNPERFPLSDAPRYGLETVCDAPRAVKGAEPLVTLSIQTGADGVWVLATAQYLPVLGDAPSDVVDGLPPTCLDVPACDALYATDGVLREACAAGGGDHRVGLGGPSGCLVPIARTPDDVGRWRSELPPVLSSLGLGGRPLLLLMPEARVRLDAVLAVLGAFRDADLPVPAVGLSLLVEGNDGPPVCNADVRDAAGLKVSGARWLGELRRSGAATVTPAAASPPAP